MATTIYSVDRKNTQNRKIYCTKITELLPGALQMDTVPLYTSYLTKYPNKLNELDTLLNY